MLVLEVLEEHGTVRFTRLGEISQKMVTKTVRQMEATASSYGRFIRSFRRGQSTA
jgi:DNA-binding HxlR family transcriptional regulator